MGDLEIFRIFFKIFACFFCENYGEIIASDIVQDTGIIQCIKSTLGIIVEMLTFPSGSGEVAGEFEIEFIRRQFTFSNGESDKDIRFFSEILFEPGEKFRQEIELTAVADEAVFDLKDAVILRPYFLCFVEQCRDIFVAV